MEPKRPAVARALQAAADLVRELMTKEEKAEE
jgi:hypothetical protein